MGIDVKDILGQDPEFLRRQMLMKDMQAAQQTDPFSAIGFALGRGAGNVASGRGFFDTPDPALQKATKIKQLQAQIAQSGEKDPVKLTNMFADALAQDPDLAPFALKIREQATELQSKQREQGLRERAIQVQERQITDQEFKNNPELLLSAGLALPEDDPKRIELLTRYSRVAEDRNFSIAKVESDLATAEANRRKIEADIIKSKTEKPRTFTPAQRTQDTVFARDYAKYISGGGSSTIQKNLNDLDEAIKILEANPQATGKLASSAELLGDRALAFLSPDAARAKDLVGGVAQSNLREVLGGQFAQKEGEALLARAYNVSVPVSDNLKRLKALRQQIFNAAKAKEEAGLYFEQEGTLVGFKGNPFTVVSKENLETEKKPKASVSGSTGNWEIIQ